MNIASISHALVSNVGRSMEALGESLEKASASPDAATLLTLQNSSVKLEIDARILNKANEIFGEMFQSTMDINNG